MISTANGCSILEATVHLPRSGPWHADLVVDSQVPGDVAGVVAISLCDAALALAGTAYRAPVLWRGVTRVRVVAGAAGLGTLLAAQGYDTAPLSVIVGDILNGAGEKLASSSKNLTARSPWSRLAGSAGAALQAVADYLSATWRALPNGTIWIGTETWPTTALTDYEVSAAQPEDGRIELATESPTLLPGTTFTGATFTGGNVGRVVYHINEESIRAEVFFE